MRETQEFPEFKKLKNLVREQNEEESITEYLREVWPLVESCTSNDSARRLWVTHLTSQPLNAREPAVKHYQRLVLEDLDDEEFLIARSRAGLENGQTLSQVWHMLKGSIPPKRYVKTLRAITVGRRGEVTFVRMPADMTSTRELEVEVKKYDLEQNFYDGKRKRGTKQPVKAEKPTPRPATPGPTRRPPKRSQVSPSKPPESGPRAAPAKKGGICPQKNTANSHQNNETLSRKPTG